MGRKQSVHGLEETEHTEDIDKKALSYFRWGYDKLCTGQYDEGKTLIHQALEYHNESIRERELMLEILLAMVEDQNIITKYCMEKHEHWIGRLHVQELRHAQRKLEVERLRQFLKENPHYNIQEWLCQMEK